MRATLLAIVPLLASCATPWAKAVEGVSTRLKPVPTLSAAYYPGSLVTSDWTVQSRPTGSASPCIQAGPRVDFEFKIEGAAIANFGVQAPKIGLKANVGLSDVSEIRVTGNQVSTFDFPVMDFKRGGLKAELQKSSTSYKRLAASNELFLVVKTLCATELVLKSTRKSGLGALVSASPAPEAAVVEAQAAVGWKANDDGSITYKSPNVPICFGIQVDQIYAADIDDTLAGQSTCPDESAVMSATTEELKTLGADCIERALLSRRAKVLKEKGRLSPECQLAAEKRAEVLFDLFLASSQLQEAQHQELCAADEDKPRLKRASAEAEVRFVQTVESVRKVQATGGLVFSGPQGTRSVGESCQEL